MLGLSSDYYVYDFMYICNICEVFRIIVPFYTRSCTLSFHLSPGHKFTLIHTLIHGNELHFH